MPATNKNKQIFVSSSTAKTLAHYLISIGVEAKEIEGILDSDIDALEAIDFRLPIENYTALWAFAVETSHDPALGITLGTKPPQDDMGLVGHIFFNNATLGDALKQYERYYSLVNEGMHIELNIEGGNIAVTYVCDDRRAYCIPDMERTLAISIFRAKQNIANDLSIEYVGFEHSAPDYAERYREAFPCSVRFDQEHTKLVFKHHFLDFKLPRRSSYLHTILTRHIESLITKIKPEPTLKEKVMKLVERKLSKDNVDASHIADKLCMSRHTLYRKLKQEGISFHELVDQVRHEKAMSYIEGNKRSLSEIAFLLGFSELSAFSRAFKRWTGQSPAKYIKQLEK